MKKNDKDLHKSWNACNDCQIRMGGKVPRHSHNGITVSIGTCEECGEKNKTLVPNSDYDWKNKKAVWD